VDLEGIDAKQGKETQETMADEAISVISVSDGNLKRLRSEVV
jgi:hypothetical protein